MQIQSLSLKNFKKFAEFEAMFSPGLNVIRGENEQGKSTVLSAILAGLFYDPSRRNQAIQSLQRWGSDELYRIEMKLSKEREKEGGVYTVQKDFEEKFFSMEERDASGAVRHSWTTVQEAQPVLTELLGTDNAKLFLATAAVRQDDLTSIHSGAKELEQALQRFVTSGGEQTSAIDVLKVLEKRLKDAEKGLDRPTVNPGTLRALMDEKVQLEQRIAELSSVVQDRTQRQQENETLRADLASRIQEQEVRRRALGTAKSRAEIQKEKEMLDVRFQELEETLRSLKEQSGAPEAGETIEENIRRLERLERAYRDLESQRGALQKRIESLDLLEELHEPNPLLNPGMIGALILTAVALGGLRFTVWSLLACVPAAGMAIWAFQKRRHLQARKKEEAEEQTLRESDDDLARQQMTMLSEQGYASIDDVLQAKAAVLKQKEEDIKAKATVDALLKGRSQADLEAEKVEVAKRLAMAEAREQELAGEPLSAEDQARLETEAEQEEAKIQRMKEQGMENRARIDATPATQDELLQVQERLAEVVAELEREQLIADAHRTAIEVILESKDEVTKKAKYVLQELVNTYLPRVTDGRYSSASVSDDLAISVDTGDQGGGEITPDGVLSRGAIDQVYLVARLALITLVFGDATPPFLLDDPFVSFDDVRKTMTMEVLSEIAQERQVFLFTHSDTYDGWAEQVVVLGE